MADRPTRCKSCQVSLPIFTGRGRPAIYCHACADKGNRGRRKLPPSAPHPGGTDGTEPPIAPPVPRARASADPLAAVAAPLESKADRSTRLAMEASEPLRLAVALSVTSDLPRAAALANLREMAPAELDALGARVRVDHADLIARRPAAIGALVWQAMALQVLNLIVRAPHMAPAQSAASAKALAQVLELVQGGTQPAYSKLIIQVQGMDDDTARIDALMGDDSNGQATPGPHASTTH